MFRVQSHFLRLVLLRSCHAHEAFNSASFASAFFTVDVAVGRPAFRPFKDVEAVLTAAFFALATEAAVFEASARAEFEGSAFEAFFAASAAACARAAPALALSRFFSAFGMFLLIACKLKRVASTAAFAIGMDTLHFQPDSLRSSAACAVLAPSVAMATASIVSTLKGRVIDRNDLILVILFGMMTS